MSGSFTEDVRQELARLPLGSAAETRAELAALLRLAGSLTVTGGESGMRRRLEVSTGSGAVARRTFALLQRRYGLRAQLLVRAPGGVRRRSTYVVRVEPEADEVAGDLGLLDARGRLRDGVPDDLDDAAALAYLRGAVLASGSISDPGRDPHLEIATRSGATATALAALVDRCTGGSARAVEASADRERHRMVMKSGAAIEDLLASVGATVAFLRWGERRLRRQLRGDANRLANADAANLRRTIDAAGTQVRVVEELVDAVGWDGIEPELRVVALARLANPGASLQELGQLLDPPVGKSVVHRRLRRLEARHAEVAPGGPSTVG
ncbi:DNA-binding protein WhiA [Egicoccus halophilus]|uniref:Probable cell division protein WhiA n=1 Tax=Egicoccus halophilus TaxID=1670830 RepID=A0A8J3ETS4_9ACTN|nr:DNA-binding protein WhiA [Egicoccus halophilus]GGI04503.1 sporulation protein [Egicoccus halophilus]